MHIRELVEIGALIAVHARALLRRANVLTQWHVEQYWRASRCRQDRWLLAMHEYRQRSSTAAREVWPGARAVVEEIVAGELLTRVWCAVTAVIDRSVDADAVEPMAQSVLQGHCEARCRALRLTATLQDAYEEAAVLERLCGQTERWTDLMIGYLARHYDVARFAFDAKRAAGFADDLLSFSSAAAGRLALAADLASLRESYRRALTPDCPNGDLNGRIAGAVLACVDGASLHAIGLPESHRLLRWSQIADDTLGLVDEVLAADAIDWRVPGPQRASSD